MKKVKKMICDSQVLAVFAEPAATSTWGWSALARARGLCHKA